jgi:hypothetical protein
MRVKRHALGTGVTGHARVGGMLLWRVGGAPAPGFKHAFHAGTYL